MFKNILENYNVTDVRLLCRDPYIVKNQNCKNLDPEQYRATIFAVIFLFLDPDPDFLLLSTDFVHAIRLSFPWLKAATICSVCCSKNDWASFMSVNQNSNFIVLYRYLWLIIKRNNYFQNHIKVCVYVSNFKKKLRIAMGLDWEGNPTN